MNEYNFILVSMVGALILGSFLVTWFESSLDVSEAERLLIDTHCRHYMLGLYRKMYITEDYTIRRLSGNRYKVSYVVFDGVETEAMQMTMVIKLAGRDMDVLSVEGSI